MIDLTDFEGSTGTPRLLDWGSTLTPAFGGVEQRLSRIGSRFMIDFQTIPYYIGDQGRRAIARLQQAKQQGGVVKYPQLGFSIGTPGNTVANGLHTGGMTLNVKNGEPNYAVRHGQALNIVKSGRRYLYFAADQAQFNSAGSGTIYLTSPMRTHLAGDETIDLREPKIEGWIDGNELEWTIDASRLTGLRFVIKERA